MSGSAANSEISRPSGDFEPFKGVGGRIGPWRICGRSSREVGHAVRAETTAPIFPARRSRHLMRFSRHAKRTLLFASGQRHHGERRPRVRDVVLAVRVQRAREPAPAFALVRLEPGDAALDGRIVGRHAGLAQHEHDEARAVTVACFGVLRRFVAALPVAERGQRPAAVGKLHREQLLDRLAAITLTEKSGTYLAAQASIARW